jgi:hypothetical protein
MSKQAQGWSDVADTLDASGGWACVPKKSFGDAAPPGGYKRRRVAASSGKIPDTSTAGQ